MITLLLSRQSKVGNSATMIPPIYYQPADDPKPPVHIIENEYECDAEKVSSLCLLKQLMQERSSLFTFVPGYGPTLPVIGSSSSIIDLSIVKSIDETPSSSLESVITLAVAEQLQEILTALSINKSQLAQILQVSRPTIYDWIKGKEPNATNMERVHILLRILATSSVSRENPLNARFVRGPTDFDVPSLIDALSEDDIDEAKVLHIVEKVKVLDSSATQRKADREDRLRALGFVEVNDEQKREQISRNVMLQNWPK